MRPEFVLVRVDLAPASNPALGNWKETWRQCLEILQRCVYLDKDLVLPPMGTSAASETFFVVAATDLQRAGIMTTRIREQLEKVKDVKNKYTLTVTTVPLQVAPEWAVSPVEQQVQKLADRVTEAIMVSVQRRGLGLGK